MAGEHLNTPEVWKAIPDFPGYEVSDHGRVRSFWPKGPNRGFKFTPRILNPGLVKGYHQVVLYKDGNRNQMKVSRLVLMTFIGPCPPDCDSCHNNGNPKDNSLYNLRWDTKKGNCLDRIKHGTAPLGENNPNVKLSVGQVLKIRELVFQGQSQRAIAKIYNVHKETIWRIANHISWKSLP